MSQGIDDKEEELVKSLENIDSECDDVETYYFSLYINISELKTISKGITKPKRSKSRTLGGKSMLWGILTFVAALGLAFMMSNSNSLQGLYVFTILS